MAKRVSDYQGNMTLKGEIILIDKLSLKSQYSIGDFLLKISK